MNNKAKINLRSTSDELRFKVLEIKTMLPSGISYMPYYEQLFGKQDETETKKVRNVWNLRIVDKTITSNLEIMVNKIKAI